MKKTNIAVIVAIAFALLFSGYAIAETKTPIVIIGGASPEENIFLTMQKELQAEFPDRKVEVIVPEAYWPLWRAVSTVLQQIRDAGIEGPVILIGHSWGGLIARQIDARNPGTVVAVITIATPLDIRFMPNFGDPFHPDDTDSETPLYVIAGIKPGVEKKWWMRVRYSDEVVDIQTALDLRKRKVTDFAIFKGENAEHSEIVKNLEVINRIKKWLQPQIVVALVGE